MNRKNLELVQKSERLIHQRSAVADILSGVGTREVELKTGRNMERKAELTDTNELPGVFDLRRQRLALWGKRNEEGLGPLMPPPICEQGSRAAVCQTDSVKRHSAKK